MTKPVVVGIDGSPESFSAAEWAGYEAVRKGLPIRLINIWQNPVSNVQFSPDPETLRLWEENQVREAAQRLTDRHPALTVTADQVYGTPATELVNVAATSEMLVIGSRGLGALSGFLHGSVGLHAMARSARPVVVVRAAESRERAETGNVVLGLDLVQSCDALIAFAFAEAAVRGAALHVMHVWGERRPYLYAAPALDERMLTDLQAKRGHELTQALAPWRSEFPDVELEESVVEGQTAQRLIEAGMDRETDLLVVGRRRRHPPVAVHLGPVAHGVLHHAPCPVAVVSHD